MRLQTTFSISSDQATNGNKEANVKERQMNGEGNKGREASK
jgi:hypothetical protein